MLEQTKTINYDEIKHMLPLGYQSLGYDVIFDTDDFDKPKVLGTFDLCVNSVLLLLFMKPGQFPSIPELGINIEEYLHEYADDRDIPQQVMDKLNDQCNRLQIVGVDIEVYVEKLDDQTTNALIIQITGSPTLTYGLGAQSVIVGITKDKLNRLYAKRRFIQV